MTDAILMCEQASILDAEIRDPCALIVQFQQKKIDERKMFLREWRENKAARKK